MIIVKDAKYKNDYIIEVKFNDNKKGIVDLSSIVNDKKIKPFQKLKDKNKFKNFKVDYTVKWMMTWILLLNIYILKHLKMIFY